jgi:hypothetical protein
LGRKESDTQIDVRTYLKVQMQWKYNETGFVTLQDTDRHKTDRRQTDRHQTSEVNLDPRGMCMYPPEIHG